MASGDATIVTDSQVGNASGGRRPRARNWTTSESLCLCAAKKVEQLRDLENAGQNRFLSSVDKWKVVAEYLLQRNYTERDHDTCKNKWNNLFGEYKAIKDHLVSSRMTDYFAMSRNERIAAKLIPNFKREVYDFLEEYSNQRPIMVPPALYDSGVPHHVPPPPPESTPGVGSVPSEDPLVYFNVPTPTTDPIGASAPEPSLLSIPATAPAPGNRVAGSTGRTRRRRNVDVAGVLRTSSNSLISALERQMMQRTLLFEQQLDVEKSRLELQRTQQEATAEDRRLMVTALQDMAHAMNAMASYRRG